METKQDYWGDLAAGCFFLVAAGAMMFIVLAIIDFSGSSLAAQLNGWGSLAAVALAGAGSLLLMIEAGNKMKAYLIVCNPASIASKNAVMMSLFMGLAFIYATFFFDFILWAGFKNGRFIIAIMGIAAALGAVIIPALELGEARGRSFWNSSGLVPLFLTSGAASGLAAVIIAAQIMGLGGDAAIVAVDRVLLAVILMQVISLSGYILGMQHSGAPEARQGAAYLLKGHYANGFWGLVIGVGNILPLLLYLAGSQPVIASVKAALVLAGGLGFRMLFLKAGIRRAMPGEENETISHEETARLAGHLEKRWQEKTLALYGKQEG